MCRLAALYLDMSGTIVRKGQTGEPGNRGQFGSHERTESTVALTADVSRTDASGGIICAAYDESQTARTRILKDLTPAQRQAVQREAKDFDVWRGAPDGSLVWHRYGVLPHSRNADGSEVVYIETRNESWSSDEFASEMRVEVSAGGAVLHSHIGSVDQWGTVWYERDSSIDNEGFTESVWVKV